VTWNGTVRECGGCVSFKLELFSKAVMVYETSPFLQEKDEGRFDGRANLKGNDESSDGVVRKLSIRIYYD